MVCPHDGTDSVVVPPYEVRMWETVGVEATGTVTVEPCESTMETELTDGDETDGDETDDETETVLTNDETSTEVTVDPDSVIHGVDDDGAAV
jgi:hypothetical protein